MDGQGHGPPPREQPPLPPRWNPPDQHFVQERESAITVSSGEEIDDRLTSGFVSSFMDSEEEEIMYVRAEHLVKVEAEKAKSTNEYDTSSQSQQE